MLNKQFALSAGQQMGLYQVVEPFRKKLDLALTQFSDLQRTLTLVHTALDHFDGAICRLNPQQTSRGVYVDIVNYIKGFKVQFNSKFKDSDPSSIRFINLKIEAILKDVRNIYKELPSERRSSPESRLASSTTPSRVTSAHDSVKSTAGTSAKKRVVFADQAVSSVDQMRLEYANHRKVPGITFEALTLQVAGLTRDNFLKEATSIASQMLVLVDTQAHSGNIETLYGAFEAKFISLIPELQTPEFGGFQKEVRRFLADSDRVLASDIVTEAGKSHLAMNLRVFAYFAEITDFTPHTDGVLSLGVRELGAAESPVREAQFIAKAPRHLDPEVHQIKPQTMAVINDVAGSFTSPRHLVVALQQFLNARPDGLPVNRKDEMALFVANSPGSAKSWFASLVADPISGQILPPPPHDLKPNGTDHAPFKSFITVSQHNEGMKLQAARLGLQTKEVTWEYLSPIQASTDFYNAHRASIANVGPSCGPLATPDLTPVQRQGVIDLLTYYSKFELKTGQFIVPDYRQVSDRARTLTEGVIIPRGKGDLPRVAGEIREANQRTSDQVVVSQNREGELLLNLNTRAALTSKGERANIYMLSGGIVNALETAAAADDRESREEAYAFPMILGGKDVQAALKAAQSPPLKLNITMSVHEGRNVWVIPSSVDTANSSPIIGELRAALYTTQQGSAEQMKRPLIVVVDEILHSEYGAATQADSKKPLPAGCLAVPSFDTEHMEAAFPSSHATLAAGLVSKLETLQDYTADVFKACLGAKKSGVLGATAVTNPEDPLTWAFHCSVYAVKLPPEMMGVAQADSDGRGVFTMNLAAFVGHLKAGNVAFNHGTFQLGAILHLIEHGDVDFEALKPTEKAALKEYIAFEGFRVAPKHECRSSWNAMAAYVNT